MDPCCLQGSLFEEESLQLGRHPGKKVFFLKEPVPRACSKGTCNVVLDKHTCIPEGHLTKVKDRPLKALRIPH